MSFLEASSTLRVALAKKNASTERALPEMVLTGNWMRVLPAYPAMTPLRVFGVLSLDAEE